ncbi:hypothetical protein M5E87_20955 [Flavonifractor plautii]|nr:hypothetical protein M5E87_20955 [Flavonifractor plautii]
MYGLLRILGPRWAWLPALLLYAAGLLGTAISASPPPCRPSGPGTRPCSSSSTTHATACSSPCLSAAGGWLALRPARRSAAWYGAGLLLSLALLTAEGLLVQRLALARFDALYLSLPCASGSSCGGSSACPSRPLPPSGTGRRRCMSSTLVHRPHPGRRRGGGPHRPAGGQLSCTLSGRGPALLPSGPPFARIRPAPPRSRAWIELDAAALRHNLAALGSFFCGGQPYAGNQGQRLRERGLGDRPAVRRGGRGRLCRGHRRRGCPPAAGRRPGTILVLGYSGPELAPCWPGTA